MTSVAVQRLGFQSVVLRKSGIHVGKKEMEPLPHITHKGQL